MEEIWLKELSVQDDLSYCDLLIELANYENAYAKPVPSDFTYDDFEMFKTCRVNMAQGKNIPEYVVPTSTYWVMLEKNPIGYATIRHKASLDAPGGHLGLCLKRSVQNKGIGTIVSNLLSEIAYNKLGIIELIYSAKDENIQSQKSLEHIGAELVSVHDGYHYYVVDLSKTFKEGRMK